MGLPEKERKDDAKSDTPQTPPSQGKGSSPHSNETPMDIFQDIDNYQKKIESEWEDTKKNYQEKIDQIMDEFSENQPMDDKSERPKSADFKKTSPEFDDFMSEVQRKLQKIDSKSKPLSISQFGRPSIINAVWHPITPGNNILRKSFLWIPLVALLSFAVYKFVFSIAPVTPLPYSHTSSLLFHDDRIYVVDWFRKALFTHIPRRGLPMEAVENLPNHFTTGIAITSKKFYSLDGFSQLIIEHAGTSDHRVLEELESPAKQSAGLFWDGVDIWTFDNAKGKLLQLRGNDLEDVKNGYSVEGLSVTSLEIVNNRAWILDGRSREIHVYRVQEPLKHLASYDLDPFLQRSIPTGFHKEKNKVWLVTEGPAQLIRVPLKKLMKSRSDQI